MKMTAEYAKLIISDAVQEAYSHYLYSPRLAGVVRDIQNECDEHVAEYSGECSAVDNAVIEDFGRFLAGLPVTVTRQTHD